MPSAETCRHCGKPIVPCPHKIASITGWDHVGGGCACLGPRGGTLGTGAEPASKEAKP